MNNTKSMSNKTAIPASLWLMELKSYVSVREIQKLHSWTSQVMLCVGKES